MIAKVVGIRKFFSNERIFFLPVTVVFVIEKVLWYNQTTQHPRFFHDRE